MLVGTLQGCSKSGSLFLQDSTGHFPVLLTSTSHFPLKHNRSPATINDASGGGGDDPSMLSHIQFGTKIMVTDFLVIFEKTINLSSTDAPSSDVTAYLHIVSFNIIPCSSSSPSIRSRSSDHPSFLVREDGEDEVLFFRVLNKNVSVISSANQLEFTCQALVHLDLELLLPHSLGCTLKKKPTREKKEMVKKVLKVAIYFGGDAYKWFSLINNGCTYSISLVTDGVLPSWDILKRNLVLRVREDMEIKLLREDVDFSSSHDVADISSQLLLPSLSTRVCVESAGETRYIYIYIYIL